jgi:serine/threonine-protein kinase
MPAAASPLARFEPHNKVAGKFRLRRRIAVGGMGEVWVARNESTGADLALKVLRRGARPNAEELEIEARFRHEAQLSAMLSHRSIVKVFDLAEEADGTLILVMELLRGETLLRYLERNGPRSTREAVAILGPILGALGHAHSLGIVHRDLTPANIFLAVDPDGHVTPKLVDFGIAKLSSAASRAPAVNAVQTVGERVLGTPRYLAPERIRGDVNVDGRVDVFAAGVVLFETITGVSPFAATTPSASLAAVLERHIDPDPRIEPRVWIEIERAIAKQPYERHATAPELATALRAALEETEASLEASLKRPHPPPGWDEIEVDPVTDSPRDGVVRTLVPARGKRLGATAWLVAAGAIGALAAVGVFAFRGWPGSASPSSATSPPAESVPALPAASASPSATATAAAAPPAPTEPPTARPTPSTAPPPRRVTLPSRPRAVATTPGF